MTRYWLARRSAAGYGWPLEEFAAAAGLHPDFVRPLVALGLLVPEADAGGEHDLLPRDPFGRALHLDHRRAEDRARRGVSATGQQLEAQRLLGEEIAQTEGRRRSHCSSQTYSIPNRAVRIRRHDGCAGAGDGTA